MVKKEATFEGIRKQILEKDFAPVYFLTGDEPYFIDELSDLLSEKVVAPEARDFNHIILYGADISAIQILNAARRYPMMSERQLVIVKEAQLIHDLDQLIPYLKNPLKSTVLVINYKNKKMDGRKSLGIALKKYAVYFESKKIPDYRMASYVSSKLKSLKIKFSMKCASMLADFMGNDLSKMNKELEKLQIVLSEKKGKELTPELIEQNIGISKDFNNFEFLRAVYNKDIKKANYIALYFEKDPKHHPIQVSLAVLFNYFENLMICSFATNKSPDNLQNLLGLRSSYQVKDYITGLRNFRPMSIFTIIHEIRMADAHSKGINIQSMESGDIMRELLYKILH